MKSFITTSVIIAGLAFGSAAEAALIGGEFSTTGSVRVSLTEIDFFPNLGGSGDFNVEAGAPLTGDFSTLSGTGDILDLTLPGDPVGVVFSKPGFLTFDAPAFSTFSFELTFIKPGIFGPGLCGAAPAAGQTCTIPGSPFNLQNLTATSSIASFEVMGFASDGSGDPASPFTGVFSTQFVNRSYQSVLAELTTFGSVSASYSANFEVNPIPEPGTMLLFGGALLGLGLVSRRKAKKS